MPSVGAFRKAKARKIAVTRAYLACRATATRRRAAVVSYDMVSASMEMSAAAKSRAETPTRGMDEALAVLSDRAREFARLNARRRADLLRACIPSLLKVARGWVDAATTAKGLDANAAAEEWLAGPMPTMRNLRLLIRTLDQIAARGAPHLGSRAFTRAPDGATCVSVFPGDAIDGALFAGFTNHVRMLPNIAEREVRERQAGFYQRQSPQGAVSLVLGAGNVASIPPMDALYKMFVDGNACLVKMNPVNEYLTPFFEAAFKPLIEQGYLRFACGGAEVGEYLVDHAAVADVHITGSDRTHDMIVWGPPGPERTRRMQSNDPRLKKSITSELGCVTPVMIVPGAFSAAELQFLAENVATMVVNNASCNCNAAKMLVTSRGWPQRELFLQRLRDVLARLPPRKAYYPGAHERYASLLADRGDQVEKLGTATSDQLAWALAFGLDPNDKQERLFTTEPFCPILSETALPSSDPSEFLAEATRFCNDRLWGTLSATVVVHPRTEADPAVASALQTAIANLRYGGVAINHWPALIYGMVTPPWGAHPSSTLANIQGGLGWVHNTNMLDGIEKSVLRGKLTIFPKPAWFATNANSQMIARKLVKLEADPGWLKVASVAASALRG